MAGKKAQVKKVHDPLQSTHFLLSVLITLSSILIAVYIYSLLYHSTVTLFY